MWATFAYMAEPHVPTVGTQLVGRSSVDDDNQLHGFYVRDGFAPSRMPSNCGHHHAHGPALRRLRNILEPG